MPRQIPNSNFANNFVLVGANINSIPYRYGAQSYNDLPQAVTDPVLFVGTNQFTWSTITTSGPRSQLKIKLVPETSQEMADVMNPQYYGGMSMMSLDGLLSPVSFYPSNWCSTFNIADYTRTDCPWCKGVGSYEKQYIDPNLTTYPKLVKETVDCPFCIPDSSKSFQRSRTVTASPQIDPPYIITTEDDSETDPKEVVVGQSSLINKFTLNPIVMSEGEFSNADTRQTGDSSAHCIDIVGAGLSPPDNGDSVRSLIGKSSENFSSQYNQRFIGLRGPLILHSWGYDIYGYPVPNKSGEFKIDAKNNIVKDKQGRNVYATQKIDPKSSTGYSQPVPEHQFRKGWAQLAHEWPVGPIDFRWDPNAEVWTMGSNYKNVWVTLESDLTQKNTAVRGAIYQEGPTTLPDGQRKVVYVKDNVGIIVAPRKATLYCRYDGDSGFYQPLYSTPLVASGIIESSNAAKIYTSYSIDENEKSETYISSFKNPLDLNVSTSSTALFTYIGGNWVLSNIKG